jgi:hypothetical protein
MPHTILDAMGKALSINSEFHYKVQYFGIEFYTLTLLAVCCGVAL